MARVRFMSWPHSVPGDTEIIFSIIRLEWLTHDWQRQTGFDPIFDELSHFNASYLAFWLIEIIALINL